MSYDLIILILSALTIGFFHTLLGPDHYLPFIALSKSGDWSLGKTISVTLLCGLGHVLGSVVLGFTGITFGLAISQLETFESFRGDLAAWFLIAFGLVYFIWGIKRAYRKPVHSHDHPHKDGSTHTHSHNHHSTHVHVHKKSTQNLTPWVLFIIFIFGPCEPLIPLLMYPAAQISFTGLIAVTTAFTLATLATMLSVVLLSVFGTTFVPTSLFERFTHALAGLTLLLCGVSIQFLGL